MLCFLIIIISLALLFFAILYPRLTVRVVYADKLLTISLRFWFYRKRLVFDFSDKAKSKDNDPTPDNAFEDSSNAPEKQIFKDKFKDIKNRILNKKDGFNLDEARRVKNEFFYTYSQALSLIKTFLSKMRRRITAENIRIVLDFGTGDAAHTGMVYGAIWSLTGSIYPRIDQYIVAEFPTLDITPDFYEKRFDIKFKSIIKVRPVHIINAAAVTFAKFGLTYLKNNFRKERENNGR